MLCFLFSALIVALDQFFKQWILRTLDVGEIGLEVIPGLLGLTRWENDGAMLNILSGQQWLLAGIAFGAAIVLIMILLRYNEGFLGTLGLAAVLGGTIGNLIDRIFNDGKVIDMFRTIPINFPIFNIADIFITLGFATFLIHFIAISFKAEKSKNANASAKNEYDDYDEEYNEQEQSEQGYDEQEYDEFPDLDATVATEAEQELAYSSHPYTEDTQYSQDYEDTEQMPYEPQYDYTQDLDIYPETTAPLSSDYVSEDYSSITDTTSDLSYSLDDIEMEYGALEDYNVDDLLREYGFDEDD